MGKRLFRTVAFGVIAGVLVGATFAWQFYGDDQRKLWLALGNFTASLWYESSSSDAAVELASKTSDRVPIRIQPFYKRRLPLRPPKCRSRSNRPLSCNTSLRRW